MSPLAGLQPFVLSVNTGAEATAVQQQGGPADPRHGQSYVQQPPQLLYQLAAGAAGPAPTAAGVQYVGSPHGSLPPGTPGQDPFYDGTPSGSHRGPWPRGIRGNMRPESMSDQAAESWALHGIDTGASYAKTHIAPPANDHWQSYDFTSAGQTILSADTPGQMRNTSGGYGTTDRNTSFAVQNSYGLDSSHRTRRWSIQKIAGNFKWMRPAGRPLINLRVGTAQAPVGALSPFAGQNPSNAFSPAGAVLYDPAVEYQVPSTPYVAPGYGAQAAPGDVAWW